MYEEKLESYKKQILDELYKLTRENIEKSRDLFHFYDKTEFAQNSPEDDKLIIDTAWGELRQQYINQTASKIRFTEYGIIRYEEVYNPSVTIRLKDLLIPVLIAVFEYKKSGNRKIDFLSIRNFVEEKYNFNIIDNDIYVILIILSAYNYLRIPLTFTGSIIYVEMTDAGNSKAIRSIPKSPIENAIKRLASCLLEFDYFEKDLNECSLRLKEWIDQFEEEKEKLAALFLVENLFIASNELSNKVWKEFYNKSLVNLTQENIYYLAAGGPGSSEEVWRHKFIREIDLGKQQSRTLKAIKEKTEPSYWENKFIVFIDDIIGSGAQFRNFFENNMMVNTDTKKEILEQFKKVNIIYFVVIATKQDINYITRNTPLKKENIRYGFFFKKFFDPANSIWKKTTPISREECLRVCETYGKKLYPEDPLGFIDSQLLVAFQDHTPDNTLPILWWSENRNWKPLLKR